MKKFWWTIKNAGKITIWLFLITVFLDFFGIILGAVLFTLFTLFWNLALTLIRAYRLDGWTACKVIFNTMFTSYFYLPLIVYGCYCSPKYGYNAKTTDYTPVDGLDEACKRHDIAMFEADVALNNGLSKEDFLYLQNRGDLIFIKEALTSKNYANGFYLLGIVTGFFVRVIIRFIKIWGSSLIRKASLWKM